MVIDFLYLARQIPVMDWISALQPRVVALIGTFLIFVMLMYRRKLNTLVGLPALALLVAVIAGLPFSNILTEVISEGAMRLHNPIIVIIFGATLAEIVKRSGIVEVMIKNTAEFLGDRLFLISTFLMLVIAILFSVLAGLGAIVMVGSIVFPIMISLGLSKVLAGCIFLLGLSLGGIMNLFNWALFTDVLKLSQGEILFFVLKFVPIALAISMAFIWIELKREGGSSFKLRVPELKTQAAVHPLAYLTPIIPVASLMIATFARFDFPIIAAMLAGILFGLLTAPKALGSKVQLLTRSIFEGINGVGPAIALMIGIGMLLKAVAHPTVKALLAPLFSGLMPTTGLSYVIFFTIAAPLALYRGPLNLWGMGSGIVALMKDSGALPGVAIMAALMAVGQIQGVSDPTNTYNVWIANYLGVDVNKFLKKTILYAWAMAMAGLLLAAALYF